MSANDNLSSEPISSNPASYLSEPASIQQEIRQNEVGFKAREKAVALFHRTYQSARGYRDFVDKSAVDVSKIQSGADFERIPIMTKEEYVSQYPLADRLVDGRTMADCYMLTATTGSTGKPSLWPRAYQDDQSLVGAFERVYRDCFQIDQRKTLHIIQNILGTTPAGMVMSHLSWAASQNHQMTTITPGMDLDQAIMMIREVGAHYDQIIVSTYPPYLKALLDRAEEEGLHLSNYRFKFACTGENFSQQFRNHMVGRLGELAAREDIISFYGCTEAGLIGAETPFSVALAEAAMDNARLASDLFGTSGVPNIMAYNPASKLLETTSDLTDAEEILITADQPAPLIRYNISDRGGLLSGKEIQQAIIKYDLPLTPPSEDAHFVYVLGRSNCVHLRGLSIYVEGIRYCLENSRFADLFTGEFQYGSKMNPQFEDEFNVVVHLKQGCELTNIEQEAFHQEFWDNLHIISPILHLFDEQILHSGMLKLSFAYGTDQAERSGKYKYFL